MVTEPGTSSHIIATENGGHHWLLFRRRDAVAQGTYEQVAKARDELDAANSADAAPAWTPKSGGY